MPRGKESPTKQQQLQPSDTDGVDSRTCCALGRFLFPPWHFQTSASVQSVGVIYLKKNYYFFCFSIHTDRPPRRIREDPPLLRKRKKDLRLRVVDCTTSESPTGRGTASHHRGGVNRQQEQESKGKRGLCWWEFLSVRSRPARLPGLATGEVEG